MAVQVPSNGITKEKTDIAAVQGGERLIKAFHLANSTDQSLRETIGQEVGLRKQRERGSTKKDEDLDFDKTATGKQKKELPRLGSSAQALQLMDSAQVPDPIDKDRECDAWDQLSAVSDCFCPASPTSSSLVGDDRMLEMSCETAASIISSMRGDGSREQARLQLGCKSREYCYVKNVKVLGVMEMN